MAEDKDAQDDLSDLSAEDRAIVLRGRALLASLHGKPKVSGPLQARSDGASIDLEELKARAAQEASESS